MFKSGLFGGAFFVLLIALLAATLFASPVFNAGGIEILEIVELVPVDQVPDQAIESSDLFDFAILVNEIKIIPEQTNRAPKKTVYFVGHVAAALKILAETKRGLDENRFVYLV
jgi:hypothetical protein